RAEEANEQKFNNAMEDDAEFVVSVADGGMLEVRLAEMAQTKATSQEVKDFAGMILSDHTKVNEELKNISLQKNISIPASLSDDKQEKYDDLNKKTGVDFDKAYISSMIKDHKKDI